MSSMILGKNIKVSIFGQSHSNAIGAVVDGLESGIKLDFDKIYALMNRRAPGQNLYSTARKEADLPKILSGVVDGITCGAPLAFMIENTDTRSNDYDNIRDVMRPSHSDYPAFIKYNGFNDVSGGGHFSGRLTAPLCFVGAICMQILNEKGIEIKSHIYSIGDIYDTPFDYVNITNENISAKDFPVINDEIGDKMKILIEKERLNVNSVGGVIECAAVNMPAGIGEPMFDGIENLIAKNIFGIPAVKGIEFGSGFFGSTQTGSQNNDEYYIDSGAVKTKTNNHGGILGGITTGMPIAFKVAIKPTATISRTQQSVNVKTMENTEILIKGRHDPCIVPRAVPVVEAVTAITLADLVL
ncbi:MAG: chorismate synthase [Oscillospiraceae bacterium]